MHPQTGDQLIFETDGQSLQIAEMLHKPVTFIVTAIILTVNADIHDEFPQWDHVGWVVKSENEIQLKCYSDRYYPFSNTSAIKKATWILPKSVAFLHLGEGQSSEGWSVGNKSDNYTLTIRKSEINVPEAVNGIYSCAALASIDPDNTDGTVVAWYYLKWGVGLYENVPAMKSGTIGEKYYWPFTYAWVTTLVTIVIILLFSLTIQFRYKGGPQITFSESEFDSESTSLGNDNKNSSSLRTSSIEKNSDYI